MTIKEAQELILFAKDNGIRKLRLDNLDFELEPLRKMVGESISGLSDGLSQSYTPTEDEMLLYSTPHFEELIADRKGN
jgi:hypothetical protein